MQAASRAMARSTTTALLRSSPPAGPSCCVASSGGGGALAASGALHLSSPRRPGRASRPTAVNVQAGRAFSELLSLRDDKKK